MSKKQLNGADVGALLQKVHANACLRECGVMGLEILQIPWAFWHSRRKSVQIASSDSGHSTSCLVIRVPREFCLQVKLLWEGCGAHNTAN
jgi:hypothetical protein